MTTTAVAPQPVPKPTDDDTPIRAAPFVTPSTVVDTVSYVYVYDCWIRSSQINQSYAQRL